MTTDTDREPTGSTLAKSLDGEGFPAKLDALFSSHFHGTRMGNDTELWNQCVRFRDAVRALHDEMHGAG